MSDARTYIEVAKTANVLITIPDANTKWLSESELTRLALIKASLRRDQYIAGHWLSRVLLARGFGGEPSEWKLLERKSNPPQVLGQIDNLRISISHSQNWIACAVANVDIGIDLEHRPRKIDASIEPLLLNIDEISGQLDADALLQRWVAKEAWIKSRSESALPDRLRQLHLQPATPGNSDVCIQSSEEWHLGVASKNRFQVELRCEAVTIPGPSFNIVDIVG